MKPSLANLPRIQRRQETRTFTSERIQNADGSPFSITVTLRAPGAVEQSQEQELAELLVERHIDGRPFRPGSPALVPSPIGLQGGGLLQPTRGLCHTFALLEVLQPKSIPPEDRLELQYLATLAEHYTDVWEQIVGFALELIGDPYGGNAAGAPGNGSSGTPSPNTADTPTSSSTEPTAPPVSTPEAAPCLGALTSLPVSHAVSTPEWGPGSAVPA